jgi:hypothetical protein
LFQNASHFTTHPSESADFRFADFGQMPFNTPKAMVFSTQFLQNMFNNGESIKISPHLPLFGLYILIERRQI